MLSTVAGSSAPESEISHRGTIESSGAHWTDSALGCLGMTFPSQFPNEGKICLLSGDRLDSEAFVSFRNGSRSRGL